MWRISPATALGDRRTSFRSPVCAAEQYMESMVLAGLAGPTLVNLAAGTGKQTPRWAGCSLHPSLREIESPVPTAPVSIDAATSYNRSEGIQHPSKNESNLKAL